MQPVYHAGELKVQELSGQTQMAMMNQRIIMDEINPWGQRFIGQQEIVLVSTTNENGQIWVSMLTGEAGFVSIPNAKSLQIELNQIERLADDIFLNNIQNGSEIGMLFIELSTRKRFRINGVSKFEEGVLTIEVRESYPNCTKYIQKRSNSPIVLNSSEPVMKQGGEAMEEIRDWISRADTFFVGSQAISGGLDVSHRGGQAGFVEWIGSKSLKIPDYKGNGMFNTLGNLMENPNAGLLFVDFAERRILQLTGRAEVIVDEQQKDAKHTNLHWVFDIEEWRIIENHHDMVWNLEEYSPFNP